MQRLKETHVLYLRRTSTSTNMMMAQQDQIKKPRLPSEDFSDDEHQVEEIDYSEFDYEFDDLLDVYYEFDYYCPGVVELPHVLYDFVKNDLLDCSKDQHPFAVNPNPDMLHYAEKFIVSTLPSHNFTDAEFRRASIYLCTKLM